MPDLMEKLDIFESMVFALGDYPFIKVRKLPFTLNFQKKFIIMN